MTILFPTPFTFPTFYAHSGPYPSTNRLSSCSVPDRPLESSRRLRRHRVPGSPLSKRFFGPFNTNVERGNELSPKHAAADSSILMRYRKIKGHRLKLMRQAGYCYMEGYIQYTECRIAESDWYTVTMSDKK